MRKAVVKRLLYYILIWIIFYSSFKSHHLTTCPLHTVSLKSKKTKSLKYMWQEQLSEYTHPSRRVKHADTFIFAPYSDTVWMKPGVHVQNNVNEILVEMVKPASCTYLRFLNLNWKKHREQFVNGFVSDAQGQMSGHVSTPSIHARHPAGLCLVAAGRRRVRECMPVRAGSLMFHKMWPLQLFRFLGPLWAVLLLARHILSGSV